MEKEQKIMAVRIGIAGILLVCGLVTEGLPRLLCSMAAYLTVGWDVLRQALWHCCKGKLFDEHFLMSIATAGAIGLGEYPEAAAVMLFYQLGELFQDMAVSRSRSAVATLMDIRPDTALLEQEGETVTVHPSTVAPGSIIRVLPGERIPLDGIIIEGSTSLDTAALTGESIPREVQPGDNVCGGCVNLTGLLRIRTTSGYTDSTVSRILELMEHTDNGKTHSERFITRFSRVYTPAVVGSAALLAVVPSLITGNWAEWLHRSLLFLVISCPCALMVSVPLTFFGGIGGASRQGILIKSSRDMEALSKAKAAAFDKTGTLTEGIFEVTAVHPETICEAELLELAALAESSSLHPISKSLRRAWNKKPNPGRIGEARVLPGKGIETLVDGVPVYVGNSTLMEELGVVWKPCEIEGTIIHTARESVYMGHIVIADRLKPESPAAITALRQAGIGHISLLTGDRQTVGQYVGRTLGMDAVYSQLLPEDKVNKTRELQAQARGGVLFVGDGINDAPVLQQADVGIAMGAMGSDAAIEGADVVLMDDDPQKVALAVAIGKRTLSIVRQNIILILVIKLLVLVLGALGIAGMWAAVFADVGVTLLAVCNALRALGKIHP